MHTQSVGLHKQSDDFCGIERKRKNRLSLETLETLETTSCQDGGFIRPNFVVLLPLLYPLPSPSLNQFTKKKPTPQKETLEELLNSKKSSFGRNETQVCGTYDPESNSSIPIFLKY